MRGVTIRGSKGSNDAGEEVEQRAGVLTMLGSNDTGE